MKHSLLRRIPFIFLAAALTGSAAGCSSTLATPAAVTGAAPTATATTTAPLVSVDPASCLVTSVQPTAGPTETSLFPAVTAADWTRGNADASVTIIVYSDFQCPNCAQLEFILEELSDNFPKDLRLVYRYFPLNQHDKALLAAQAAEAAGMQGKFWEMHDLLFNTQDTWANVVSPMTQDQFTKWLGEQAVSLGMDGDQFASDLTSQAVVDNVAQAKEFGLSIGIPGTPLILLNGEIWQGPIALESLRNLVRTMLLSEKQFAGCPPVTIDPQKQYIATLKTAKGDIVIQLYADKAPFAVNSFVFLAQKGWFDGMMFFKVVSSPDIAQTGDPSATGWGGPGYTFKDELSADLKFDKPGVVALANSGPDTNGSQFFITKSAIPSMDGLYTIVGQVISGMDVVNALTPRDPSQAGDLPEGDQVIEVTIQEK